ncbi:MAG: HPP family protein [Acidobacteriales bacterium]|nr:HPP family protein [Terriglobales bacterium]
MRNLCRCVLCSWGTTFRGNAAHYLWVLLMFAVLAGLKHNRIGLFLVPPFGATLTLLLVLPEASVAQPWAVVAGSVAGAATGVLLSLVARGSVMAILAAVLAFAVMNLIRAYHPPGVALAMYPLLLHTGLWFPLDVVLPFTLAAAGSAALLSRLVRTWPAYPKPLTSHDFPVNSVAASMRRTGREKSKER